MRYYLSSVVVSGCLLWAVYDTAGNRQSKPMGMYLARHLCILMNKEV